MLSLASSPFVEYCVVLLAPVTVFTEELKLSTELQLRLVSRSEASSEPQKALLADCVNEVDVKSREGSRSKTELEADNDLWKGVTLPKDEFKSSKYLSYSPFVLSLSASTLELT